MCLIVNGQTAKNSVAFYKNSVSILNMNSIFSPALENKPVVVNGPKVGDILVSISGYEASIASWAKVVAVTGKSVKIVRLPADNKYTGGGGMEWISTPATDRIKGETETKRFTADGDGYRVKNNSYSNYYVWSGKPIQCYNYH